VIETFTAHVDTFTRDRLPPKEQWPDLIFTRPEFHYPERLNCASRLLDRHVAEGNGSRRCVLSPTQAWTYAELLEKANRIARVLIEDMAVVPGNRVLLRGPNTPMLAACWLAVMKAGAVAVTTMPLYRKLELRYMIEKAQVRHALCDARFVDDLEAATSSRAGFLTVTFGTHDEHALETHMALKGTTFQNVETAAEDVALIGFTSGTTGLPKAIVHGHGGQLLEHHKNQGLGWDLKPGGRLLWFSTTAWMMWNALVSALLLRSSIVMLDGDPTWPDLLEQWRLAEELGPSVMGVSPPYLMACRKAGLKPGEECDLGSLRVLCTAGSPLPAEGYRYVYEQLAPELLLINGSGGTDVCTGLVSGSFAQPVYEGEISGPCLGVDAHAFDIHGNEVIDELGELVITKPMPSMPVGLWGDADGSRYRASYFDRYPGIWRQGDWIRFTERGSCVITGRSDATLNRGGVRLGTGEFYEVIEELPEILDALVVHLEDAGGGAGELLLFVVAAEGAVVDESLRRRIAATLRNELSPRHVPDGIVAVPAIPRTLTGKKLESPVKRILRGDPAQYVASRDSLADPTALDAFVALASERRSRDAKPRPALP